MKNNQKKMITTALFLMIAAVLLVGGFYMVIRNKGTEQKKKPVTEVEKLISKDIEGNYPGNSRQVLKLYGRITKCLYNDDMTQEQFEQLAKQLRLLFDEELLANNPEDTFISGLKAEIDSYRQNKQRIQDYEVLLASETKYSRIKGENYETSKISFLVQKSEGSKEITRTYEEFLLREDKNGNYKIAHWQQSDASGFE